jgi:hypothetical protein
MRTQEQSQVLRLHDPKFTEVHLQDVSPPLARGVEAMSQPAAVTGIHFVPPSPLQLSHRALTPM